MIGHSRKFFTVRSLPQKSMNASVRDRRLRRRADIPVGHSYPRARFVRCRIHIIVGVNDTDPWWSRSARSGRSSGVLEPIEAIPGGWRNNDLVLASKGVHRVTHL